ncbi:MAG: AFG1/ZapE family ATPase, partial [Pseudomonadota bacterium]|nr:AFG1/ZapE family ATPase [Pseudomonadota bacterium]
MTSQPQSPLDAYESALASGELRPQVAQRRAVEALEDLYRELSLPPAIQKRRREAAARARRQGASAQASQQPTRRGGLLGWLAALFTGGSGSQSGADAEAGAATRETSFARSLYLFGPVGRGKTTAMDFFYAALGPKRAQRRHFHEFMSELHADIHARREKGDARG